ncbi:integrase core domain-containing protein [Bacteriovoracaceae bacterium]|nr:integrase core domain-containing protein [Bacteriovoracaceae bacterium]
MNIIVRLKELNPKWGAQRISDELKKSGHRVSKPTVLKYLQIYCGGNPPKGSGLSWNQFLENHKFKIGFDFTSMIDLFGRQLFILVILNLDTRELIFINATYNPDRIWLTQQFRNAFYEYDEYPSLCICDNDGVFGKWLPTMLEEFYGTKVRKIPYKKPEYNGRVERFHFSLKSEGFNYVVPITLLQTQRICSAYRAYYNNFRNHQGLDGKIPALNGEFPENRIDFSERKHLNGAITTFELEKKIAA